ncbi:hypothetical protein DL237_17370 [Pseudooceanicola sediminis]|uniref:Uncharacterized protein n=1 Tax=Pseudooceanicola sediminis TaxID=2211117 RepID=A0A399IYU7_9RHOB|nr:hypothetical protein DL237_17370 [Pseudooceanicola sediminis]
MLGFPTVGLRDDPAIGAALTLAAGIFGGGVGPVDQAVAGCAQDSRGRRPHPNRGQRWQRDIGTLVPISGQTASGELRRSRFRVVIAMFLDMACPPRRAVHRQQRKKARARCLVVRAMAGLRQGRQA